MTELETKAAEINAANNKLIADIQAEFDRKSAGFINESQFADVKATWQKRWDAQENEIAKLKAGSVKSFETKDEPSIHTKAYGKYLRNLPLDPEERKVLTIADSTHAGVLAPPEYTNQILHYAYVQHPIRQVANVRQTSQERVYLPVNDAFGVATWEAESATKTETTGLTYALTTIIPQEMKILYKATQKMLEDSQFNLEAEIAYAVGRAMGNLESTAYFSGNGTTTGPEGLHTNATIEADHIDNITDNTLAFDDFIKTFYTLEEPYAQNGSWLLNRTTLGVCVGLKSATTNTYLLQPNLQAGQPATILGAPVYTWSACTAVAASTGLTDDQVILFFGDFRQGYTVVDRVGMTIQRLNELYAADGMIGFYARMRVGGGVVIPPAIQKLRNQKT